MLKVHVPKRMQNTCWSVTQYRTRQLQQQEEQHYSQRSSVLYVVHQCWPQKKPKPQSLFHLVRVTFSHGIPLNQQPSGRFPSSVVIFLHFCPVGDPEFFVELVLRLESPAQLVPLLPAYFHSMVLRHHLVVDSSFKEPTLRNRNREWEEKKEKKLLQNYSRGIKYASHCQDLERTRIK